jgi:hypothetical protein
MSQRTRTKRTNGKAPVRLSELSPDEYNVRPGEQMTIVCRACRQWRRVMGATTLKVIEHGTSVCPGTRQITRSTCDGSRQIVVVDIDVAQWMRRQNRLGRDGLQPQVRRSAQQFSKPTPPTAPAVSQVEAPLLDVDAARDAHLAHRKRCTACRNHGSCTDGRRLADLYVRLSRQEPARRRHRELLAEVTAENAKRDARQAPKRRTAEWAKVLPAVESTDRARQELPPGDFPNHYTGVPLEPPKIHI